MAIAQYIVSGFKQEFVNENSATIDFTKASKIDCPGTICDTYVLYYNERKVFVKRLKEEYRTSPKHLDALHKEYALGLTLSHPSLPTYYDRGEDYIVLNYIDGRTLSQILANDEVWLKSGQNAIKMMLQLLDATDYLHARNIVHCDIKPDNIMISEEAHNLVLIDLDKAYTGWKDKTPGAASIYGREETPGRTEKNDLACLAVLAESLADSLGSDRQAKTLKKFARACASQDVSSEQLRRILARGSNSGFYNATSLKILLPAMLCILSAIVLMYLIWPDNNTPENDEQAIVNSAPETESETGPVLPAEHLLMAESVLPTEPQTEPLKNNSKVVSDGSKSPNGVDIAKLERTLQNIYKPFDEYFEEVDKNLDAGKLEKDDVFNVASRIMGYFNELTLKAYGKMKDEYPDIAPIDLHVEVQRTKAYRSRVDKRSKMLSKMNDLVNGSQEDSGQPPNRQSR